VPVDPVEDDEVVGAPVSAGALLLHARTRMAKRDITTIGI
jgi:hypothetical protein